MTQYLPKNTCTMQRLLSLTIFLLLAGGCTSQQDAPEPLHLPPLFSMADSLAFSIEQAAGGRESYQSLETLRFDWAVERDSQEAFRARHLWDRTSGAYRVEYPIGEDSLLVAVFAANEFDMDMPEGRAFINGVIADSVNHDEYLKSAYERFINDSYWLVMPFKLFDDGVDRTIAHDSSDADTDVLRLRFENVGLTPGDQYWLRADSTGQILSWSFTLESGGTGYFEFLEYAHVPTPAGSLFVSTRKQDGGRAILTEILPADSVSSDIFSDPHPRF